MEKGVIFSKKRLQHMCFPVRYSLRKGVVRSFAKFTGKHLCQSLFYDKVVGWPAKFLRIPYPQNT